MELTIPMSRADASDGDVIAFERRVAPGRAAIGVLLAHEEGLARAGLRALLEREPDMAVSGEASRGEDVIALAGELCPDVVLIDVRLHGLDALEVTRRLVGGSPGTKVVMLSNCERDDELFGSLQAGARGFVAPDADRSELLRAIRSVAKGQAALSPSLTRRLIDEFSTQPDRHRPVPERLEELTAREREVMGLVAIGLTNQEIAERLVVTTATAKTHVSRAMRKLHARHRAQLVTLAYQARLVDPARTADRPLTTTLLAAA